MDESRARPRGPERPWIASCLQDSRKRSLTGRKEPRWRRRRCFGASEAAETPPRLRSLEDSDERKEEATNEARATMNEPYYWYRRDALKVVPNFH